MADHVVSEAENIRNLLNQIAVSTDVVAARLLSDALRKCRQETLEEAAQSLSRYIVFALSPPSQQLGSGRGLKMINEREYLLSCVAEEAAEVSQRALKAIRFGLFEKRPAEHGGTGLNNWQALAQEFEDLLTAVDVLMERNGLVFMRSEEATKAKRAKIQKYLDYANSVGQVRGAAASGE